jgi:hypothetical protein
MKCFIHRSIFLPAIHLLPLIHYYARLIMVEVSLSYSDYQPKPYGKSMVRLTFCSAINEIRKNKIRLEDGDRRLLLNFGLPCKRCRLFCEEYLRPRICKGLFDRLATRLVLALGEFTDTIWSHQRRKRQSQLRKNSSLSGVLDPGHRSSLPFCKRRGNSVFGRASLIFTAGSNVAKVNNVRHH